ELADAGRVDDDARVTEVAPGRPDRVLHRSRITDVDLVGPGDPSVLADLGGGLLGRLGRDVEASDRGAFFGQQAGGGVAETTSRPGDQCNSSLEASHGARRINGPPGCASPAGRFTRLPPLGGWSWKRFPLSSSATQGHG